MNTTTARVEVADWRSLPLTPGGRGVIEASAGTGKTWTIAALYLRLLLEAGHTPRQIVVATFTDAAASELRERLRARLLSAEAMARDADAPLPANDAVAAWLDARWQGDARLRSDDLNRLRLAMAELDVAPVGTLHGLCARILREQPFAAGSGFEPGELVDGSALMGELDADLRRLLGQGDQATLDAWMPRELQPWLAAEKIDAHALASLLKPGTDIRVIHAPALPPDAADILREGAREGMFGAKSKIARIWRNVAEHIESDGVVALDKDALDELRLDNGLKLVSKLGKNNPAVQRAAALSPALVEPLQARIDQQRLHVWKHLRDWAIAHKQAWMQRHVQRSFDDLLLDVHAALAAERDGDARPLADALHAAWPVALVDEFQDTDGLQYGILDAIYRDADDAPRSRLVMIGDPKQAIYRFRGGDIHTYQRAAASAGEALSLRVNQRSSRTYVDGVNRFFALAGPELDAGEGASSGIAYLEVEASGRRDGAPYAIAGQPLAQALHIHFNDTDEIRQPRRVALALQACANDIAGMLADGGHRIGSDPLSPGDIAVLLPKGRDVLQLRRLLEARGVPCVTQARDSVFATATARDLQVLLHGVLHAESLPQVRAALATPLLGWSLARIAALDEDPVATQAQVARFHGWRDAWRRRGVLACVDALMAEEGPRWLAGDSGERRLTDLRHLGEALQAEADAGSGPVELVDWLAEQRTGQGDDGDEARDARQLRIESEAPRVRLMTLHASKGLEFPLVFLPLMWAHGEQEEKGLVALTEDKDGRRWLRLDEAAREVARREQQDERFRVLYVALTRAVHACHVYALSPDRAADGRHKNKPAIGTARSALDALLSRMPHPPMSPELIEAAPEIAWHRGWASEGFVRHAAEAQAGGLRNARAMPPDPAYPLPSRHSFSTLTRGLQAADATQADAAEDEAASPFDPIDDLQDGAAEAEGEHPELIALAQKRGTGIGNALHAVLERRVIGQPLAGQGALLRESLVGEGLWKDEREGQRLAATLAKRLDAVLATPLADDMPALGALAHDQLRAEMEFYYALGDTSLQRLREACIAHGAAHLLPEGERALRGLMTGKIDLLFAHDGRVHVLDWKGNFLGLRTADYAMPGMAREMAHHHYGLQALLYTVALERHLRLRVPGYERARHLGDAWYLFVRGVGLASGAGVWRHRFSDGLLDAVDAALPGIAKGAAA